MRERVNMVIGEGKAGREKNANMIFEKRPNGPKKWRLSVKVNN